MVIFDPDEINQIIRFLIVSRFNTADTSSYKLISIEDDDERCVVFMFEGGKFEIGRAAMLSAVLSYCARAKIPLAVRANKSLKVLVSDEDDKELVLICSINMPFDKATSQLDKTVSRPPGEAAAAMAESTVR